MILLQILTKTRTKGHLHHRRAFLSAQMAENSSMIHTHYYCWSQPHCNQRSVPETEMITRNWASQCGRLGPQSSMHPPQLSLEGTDLRTRPRQNWYRITKIPLLVSSDLHVQCFIRSLAAVFILPYFHTANNLKCSPLGPQSEIGI